MHCRSFRGFTDGRIDFVQEFEVVDPTSEDVNPNGPVVGQEHVKDFGDPFIPEGVYNGWKGNKDFEMMKVYTSEIKLIDREVIKKMRKNFLDYS
jgi:hypothetical protein